jgi:hypothetical protein
MNANDQVILDIAYQRAVEEVYWRHTSGQRSALIPSHRPMK